MTTPRSRLRVLLVTLAAIACVPRPYSRAGDIRRDVGFTRKTVAGKEEPSTVIAHDGTRCIVTRERFAQVRQGEAIWCDWKAP